MKAPAYENAFGWRLGSLGNIVLSPIFLLIGVLWYGLPILWRDLPKQARWTALTLWHGKPGPYNGVYW